MSARIVRSIAVLGTMLAVAACDQRNPLASSPLPAASASTPASTGSGVRFAVNGGTSLTETLSGSAINGVVPEGQSQADESQFANGGSTTLTVQVKNVNLPDGTVLGVTLDFTPVASLTITRGEGSVRTSLGHFGVSRDQVRVNSGATTILAGAFFR